MNRTHDGQLLGSIMDRLDGDPARTAGVRKGKTLPELKLSVCRDLENLLNTRRRCVTLPPQCSALGKTLVDYGMSDFTGFNMTVPSKREEMRLEVETAIARFEPRLTKVAVSVQSNTDRLDRTLRLRITGVLHATPVSEDVVFDSELKPSPATIEVKLVT